MSLGTKPIGSLLVQYSVPAIIASVVTSLYNIVDSIFIGRGVGAMAIAGLAIVFPLMNLVVAFVTLVASGGSTISSIFLGQKNIARATDVVNNVMTLSVIHSVVFGGISLLFLDEILTFFGATPETLPYSRSFMFIILIATPLSYIFISLNNMMRATGYPKKAMISALVSVLVNVIVAPVLIFGLELGIAGAAIATVCGQFAAFVWVMHHFMSKNSFVHFDLKCSWFNWVIIKRIYSIGMSPFLMNICACVVVIILNRSLLMVGGEDGNLSVGAYGILNRTAMFFVMVVFGVTQGMQPILGFNYGAERWDRVKKTLRIGIVAGVCVTTAGFILNEFFPEYSNGLFTDDETLLRIADSGSRIFFLAFPFVGCQIVIQNFFQSIGKPKLSIFLSLTRQLLFLIPFLLILPPKFGITGVWASICSSDFIAFIFAVVTLWVMMRKMERKIENNRKPTDDTQFE